MPVSPVSSINAESRADAARAAAAQLDSVHQEDRAAQAQAAADQSPQKPVDPAGAIVDAIA
jgi:hypothetical protein